MASILSAALDKAAYAPGDTVTLTVDYAPDTPGVISQVSTVTVELKDAAGNVLASSPLTLTVNVPQAGDKVSVSDDGNHTWTVVSDNGSAAVFTTSV